MDVLVQIGGLVLVFLAGGAAACYRLKGHLCVKKGDPPATTQQAIMRALGGGGPGVEE
jgi:hypothetical protein